MTISRLMLATALIGTLALPALARTHVTTLGSTHHATALRHHVAKPTGPLHPVAAPGVKPVGSAAVAAPAAASATK